MKPNSVVHAATLTLDHEPVPSEQSVRGEPTTAADAIDELGGLEVGVWEMTPGVMNDVEAEEVFVVLSGAATVEFGDGSDTLYLGPGDVVRLSAGAETVWTVTETLRKVYLTGG
ncbi:MAG TPA: cupin domain-containing protein [Mycobacterium sp.]|nr:cupin domain-containing protein [Mycobacterium sp.]